MWLRDSLHINKLKNKRWFSGFFLIKKVHRNGVIRVKTF